MEIAMRSTITDMSCLLASRGLVFSNVTGFSPRRADNLGREPLPQGYAGGDRSYWSAYDYFMHEREQRTLRRARVYADVRMFVTRLARQLLGPGDRSPAAAEAAA